MSALFYIFSILVIITFINKSEAVRCFQCSSDEDGPYEDNCGAYRKFSKLSHIAIDCASDESHMPGSFCMKVTQQSPRGFIWDGRWRQVIRRCASVADTGVTGVCNWGVYENGIYWEECYCSEDECNNASIKSLSTILIVSFVSLLALRVL
ncbi:unnamed protein product [Psylliodes chrysocephalus]|uniref:Protein sleepless n=1 Tax=Psylliodes chrysocephalus TaxID=3402493 RepID=A0A9P0CFW5_9CUCU|nr:unnamed protein product [Psylliodes chrysocephala]